jgi:hypothetical protein
MFRVDRAAGKRLQESGMPSDVQVQSVRERLLETAVCRG